MEKCVDLKEVKNEDVESYDYTSPTMSADTLFTFCDKLEYIIVPLKNKYISARYCTEEIDYLKIPKIGKICFPMKCFCDINMHKLKDHLSWYGYYGLAFTKKWGMNNGIQPLQYFNPNSELSKDYISAFEKALSINKEKQTKEEKYMKNYLLHQLMYYKPYSGEFLNRVNGEISRKCFMDECEWRYVPNVSKIGYNQIYYNETIIEKGREFFKEINSSMMTLPEVSLKFNYDDLKYIIINNNNDFNKLIYEISHMGIKENEQKLLISKIIIWQQSGGDF